METAADIVVLNEVVKLLREHLFGLFEGVCEVIEFVRPVVHVVLHRPERWAVEGAHHVLEQCISGRRSLSVCFDDGFELFGPFRGLVCVFEGLIDAETAAAFLPGEQRVELVVDFASDPRPDTLYLVGVLGERLELEHADRRVAEEHVLADTAAAVAGDGAPAARFGVRFDDVFEDFLPVADAHT